MVDHITPGSLALLKHIARFCELSGKGRENGRQEGDSWIPRAWLQGTSARAHSAPFSGAWRRLGSSARAFRWRSLFLLLPSWGLRVVGSALYSGRSAQRLSALAGERAAARGEHCGPERVGAEELGKGGGGGAWRLGAM